MTKVVYRRWPSSPWYVYMYENRAHVMHLDYPEPRIIPVGCRTEYDVSTEDQQDLVACLNEVQRDHMPDELDLPE